MTVRELLNDIIEGLTVALGTLWEQIVGSFNVAFWPFGFLDADLAHASGGISIYAFAYLMYRTVREVHSDSPLTESREELAARIIFTLCFTLGLVLAFIPPIQDAMASM